MKQVTRSKRKQVIRETHILTIYVAPNLQCLLGRIRPRRPHGVNDHRTYLSVTNGPSNVSQQQQQQQQQQEVVGKISEHTTLGLLGIDKLDESGVRLVEQDLDSQDVAVHAYIIISQPHQHQTGGTATQWL